eukprot:1211154-Pleurochrysis_carterae.AAC.3
MAGSGRSAGGSAALQWTAQIAAWTIHLKGEDCFKVERLLMKEERLLVAVVADGHGGQKASKYCSEKIIHHMEEFAQGNPSMESLSEACTQAFRKAHAVICALPGPRPGKRFCGRPHVCRMLVASIGFVRQLNTQVTVNFKLSGTHGSTFSV